MSEHEEEDDSQIETNTEDEEEEEEEENTPIDLDNQTELQLPEQDDDLKAALGDDDGDDEDEDDGIDISTIPDIEELRNNSSDISKDQLFEYIDKYQSKTKILTDKLSKLREVKKGNVKKHRESVIDLHNRMFKKLIETETEQKTELQRAKETIADLEKEIKIFNLKEEQNDAANRGDLASFSSNQIQTLMDSESLLKLKMIDLETKLKSTSDELSIEKMKNQKTTDSHRKSISTLHTNMFKKLLDAEDDFEEKIDRLTDELGETKKKLQQEVFKNASNDKLRRDSIQTVHNNMLTKLLDAQAEHDEETEILRKEVKDLRHELRKEQLQNEVRAEEENLSDVSDLEQENNENKNDEKNKDEQNADGKDFDDLWGDDEEAPEVEINRLKDHIQRLEAQLKEEKENNVNIEKQRKDSIHNLHNNMFQKLLDAEFEYEEEIERLHKEKEQLNEKIIFYEEHFEKMGKDTKKDENIINPTEIIELNEQIKEKEEIIEENKQKIFDLTQQIAKLEEQIESEQKQRRSSVSFLSKQMMQKLLEAEDESEEEKKRYKEKIDALEHALKESNSNAFNLEKTRRNSLTTVSKAMFQKLLDAEQTKKEMKSEYEQRINELEQQLEIEKLRNETSSSKGDLHAVEMNEYKQKAEILEVEITTIKQEHDVIEKKRRESFSELRNNMWKTLLDAEDDYETQIEKLKKKIIQQKKENVSLQKDIEFLTASKLNLLNECNRQMDDLRTAITIYNKNGHQKSWFG